MDSNAMRSISLAFLLSQVLISFTLTTAQTCYDTGNFTTDSTYGKNRNLILSSLHSKVAANGGFYASAIGQDSDKVYALAQCRGDLSSETCYYCVNFASQAIVKICPNQKEAISWGDAELYPATRVNFVPCVVRYSNRSIFSKMEISPQVVLYNVNNISSDWVQFDDVWNSLMYSIVTRAAAGSSRRKFATEEANFTDSETIYAMGQCTSDLSQSECSECLQGAVDVFKSCCHGKQGGPVLRPSCIFRFDLYPFYELTAEVPPPGSPPSSVADHPPPPSTNTASAKANESNTSWTVIIIVVSAVTSMILIGICICIFVRKKRKPMEKVEMDEIGSVESLQFDFSTIRVATDFFSDANKLGQGGFGPVYKGKLPNGQDIAVKRLSTNSGQGDQEFKNEVLLVAKLQHRNLVRLLGFCMQGNERLLIYEFVPNTSLDNYLFNPIKREQLDWERRYQIIGGISRGLLYLHEDSRPRVIHRDLKASNILLDAEMNPKIADFGMARLFVVGQTQGSTNRIVGTYGYMAPEYAMHGYFSVKSDVYSFGVLLLEIVSGQKNSYRFRNGEDVEDLLSYAWKNWSEGTASNLIDPTLRNGSMNEIVRCIHIGLLCVQENEVNRPTMASVVQLLSSSSLTLPVPSEPAFFMQSKEEMKMPLLPEHNSMATRFDQSQNQLVNFSVNEVSITELYPR